LNLGLKKTLHDSAQNRVDVKLKREEWKSSSAACDRQNLVFLDESSINTGMTRLYARAKGGKRIVDYIPDVRYQAVSILSSVRLSGETVPLVYEEALNGKLFAAYIKEFLTPTLNAGDIVIMDNLTSHKVAGAIQPILDKGATVIYLPPYSPDFNPVELMWSKLKTFLRKQKARAKERLFDKVANALKTISITDINSWFVNDGY
jgi:transposase